MLIDIAVFAVIVMFFLYSLFSLKKTNAEPRPEPQKLTRELERSTGRSPASAGNNESTQVLRLECLPMKSSEKHSTTASMLRIEANLCSKKNKIQFYGKNKNTNEDILFFELPAGGRITTNYIPMRQGKNIIQFYHFIGASQKSEELEIYKE